MLIHNKKQILSMTYKILLWILWLSMVCEFDYFETDAVFRFFKFWADEKHTEEDF